MGLDDYHVLELIGEGSFGKVTPLYASNDTAMRNCIKRVMLAHLQ